MRAPERRRASAMVAAAEGAALARIEAEPLGRRDARLLALRRDLIGDAVTARCPCAACGAEVEARFGIGDLLAADGQAEAAPSEIAGAGVTVRLQRLTAGALADLAASHGHAGEAVLRRAIVDASVAGCEDAAGEAVPVPEALMPKIAEALALLDPLSAISFALECPDCRANFEMDFDPPGFVWAEVSARAKQTMGEVDRLARAYGWSEDAILALAPARRQAYLEMVGP